MLYRLIHGYIFQIKWKYLKDDNSRKMKIRWISAWESQKENRFGTFLECPKMNREGKVLTSLFLWPYFFLSCVYQKNNYNFYSIKLKNYSIRKGLAAFFCPLNRMTTDDKKAEKSGDEIFCKNCDFKCSRLCDYKRHIMTAKHKKNDVELQLDDKKSVKSVKSVEQMFVCKCSKIYKYRQGLWKHKQICNYSYSELSDVSDDIPNKEIIQILLHLFTFQTPINYILFST